MVLCKTLPSFEVTSNVSFYPLSYRIVIAMLDESSCAPG